MVVGRRKYNRGRYHAINNQIWFVGGIDTVIKEVFYEQVPKRDSDNLRRVILKHVRKGSIIYTDSWRAYWSIREFYTHKTVNHRRQFMNGSVNT